MARAEVSLDVGNDGVAVIAMSNPPINALAFATFSGLKEKFNEVSERDDVKAIVLIGKGGRFSSGLDIKAFEKVPCDGNRLSLHEISIGLFVNTIEGSNKPVVAAIEGLALGGGLELAMGCHARIAAPRAQLGLPELLFGIIPGGGGTQRLPRLVGLSNAVEMMLSSKTIFAEEGKKFGLIDSIVSSKELLKVSRLWALEIAARRKPWLLSLYRTDNIGSLFEAREILKVARQKAMKTAPNMPHHQMCLDMIEEGIVHGGYSGVMKEYKVFEDLVSSDISKGLIHVFFAQRSACKVPNVTDTGLKPRHIKKVAVTGGGLMGSGIATALILSNINVVLKEINSECLLKGKEMIEANVQGLVAKRKLTRDNADKSLLLLNCVLDYAEFKDVEMVIEAVTENIPLKQAIFSEIEKACPSHCILASTTSTIDLHIIGKKTSSQDRIVGAHFFSPAHLMPLLEIVRTEKTSPQVILDLMAIGKIMKKVPVVVSNRAGFAVNRTVFPFLQAALILVNLGVDMFRIDRVIKKFGFPLNPFHLGEINGREYHIYEKESRPKPDHTILPILEKPQRLKDSIPGRKPISITDLEILEMILFPAVNEACRVLEEGIVVRAADLDIASVLGMSFPSYRGGIVFWADMVGPKHVYSSLEKWSKAYGNFYKPSRYLEDRATKGMVLSQPYSSPLTASRARI